MSFDPDILFNFAQNVILLAACNIALPFAHPPRHFSNPPPDGLAVASRATTPRAGRVLQTRDV
jgi:hypothetical protein